MIKEHICEGSEVSVYHTFDFYTNEMNFIISKGAYFLQGIPLLDDTDETTIPIPINSKDMEYEVILTKDGISVVVQDLSEYQIIHVDNFVDKLAWFIVPANMNTLDNIEINVRKVDLPSRPILEQGEGM